MTGTNATADTRTRPLRGDDLERMIIIDQAHTGRSRRRFLAKRLRSATKHPENFVHLGIDRGGVLVGFVLARLLQGEFGRADSSAALDLLGVAPDGQEHGYGHALMDGLLGEARQRGVQHLQSEAEWTNHSLLRFFDATGFKLASRVVLERRVGEPFNESVEDI
ncbi:MAG TPA: GNAT family N-acetyltransferase [Steroidobacteraceae bacterium]|nr:GNAT family N-acetyltransferase [Steroidobacteraceae bacterium]